MICNIFQGRAKHVLLWMVDLTHLSRVKYSQSRHLERLQVRIPWENLNEKRKLRKFSAAKSRGVLVEQEG